MKIYRFSLQTGVYQGEDFTDDRLRGTSRMPADATEIAPPHVEQGEIPVFDVREQRWQVRKRLDL